MAYPRQDEMELTAVGTGSGAGGQPSGAVDPKSTSVYRSAMEYAESFKGLLHAVGVPSLADLRKTTETSFVRGEAGTFVVMSEQIQVKEDCGVARITVRRMSGTAPCVIKYKTIPVSAVAGQDYNSVSAGSLRFAFEQQEATAEILVYDNDGYENDRTFKVVFYAIDYGKLVNEQGTVLQAAMCLVTIKDNDFDLPRIILNSSWFQMTTAFATVYALFGTEIAQIHATKDDDFAIGCVTGLAAGIFFIEIAFTLYVKGTKYANTVMFVMDVIAMLALIPLIPAVARAMSSLSSFSETGVLARAGRAARAGSRAGRTIKLPRLIAKVAEFAATLGELAAKAKKLTVSKSTTKLVNDGDLTMAAKVAENQKAKENAEVGPSASKVGAALLELFTGKVIVMMLMLLVLAAFLINEIVATQQKMGLDMLHAAYVQGGNSFDTPGFKHTLWVYTEGGGVGDKWSAKQKLLYLKIDNKVVPRLDPASISSDNRASEWIANLRFANETAGAGVDPAALLWNDDAALRQLRETELRYASDITNKGCSRVLEKGVNAHRSDACPEAAIFDNKANMDEEALFSLVMTCSIVVILGIGMGLIASDLQVLILDPVERLTSLIRTLGSQILGASEETEEAKLLAKEEAKQKKAAHKVDRKTMQEDSVIESGRANSSGIVRSAVGMAFGSSQNTDDEDDDRPSMMDTAMKHLVTIQAAFPPEEPLVFFIEALNDVEGAFGFKLEGVRRTLIQLQDFMKSKLYALDAAQERIVMGDMTMRQAREVFNELVNTDRLPDDMKGMAMSNPYVQAALVMLPMVDRTWVFFADTIEMMIATRAKMLGLMPLDAPSRMMTLGIFQEIIMVELRGLLAMVFAANGRPVPSELASADFTRLQELSRESMRGGLILFMEKRGIPMPPELRDAPLADLRAQAERLIIAQGLQRIPGRIRVQLPEAALEAHTIVGLRRALRDHAKTEMHAKLKRFAGASSVPIDATTLTLREYRDRIAAAAHETGARVFGGSALRVLVDARNALGAIQTFRAEMPAQNDLWAEGEAGEVAMSRLKAATAKLKEELQSFNYPDAVAELVGPLHARSLPPRSAFDEDPVGAAKKAFAVLASSGLEKKIPARLHEESLVVARKFGEMTAGFREFAPALERARRGTLTPEDLDSLLDKLHYPDAFVSFCPPGVELPSKSKLVALPKEKQHEVLKILEDPVRRARTLVGSVPVPTLDVQAILADMGIPASMDHVQASSFASEGARQVLMMAARRAHRMEGTAPPADLEHGMTLPDLFSHVARLLRGIAATELAEYGVVVPGLAPPPPGLSAAELAGDEPPGALVEMLSQGLAAAKSAAGTASRELVKRMLQVAAKAGVPLGDHLDESSSLGDVIDAARKTLVPMIAERLREKVLAARAAAEGAMSSSMEAVDAATGGVGFSGPDGTPTLDDLRKLGDELASRAEAKARAHVAAAAASPATNLPSDAKVFLETLLAKTPSQVMEMDSTALNTFLDTVRWDDVRGKYVPSLPPRAEVAARRDELVALLKSPKKLFELVKEAAISAGLDRGEESARSAVLTAARQLPLQARVLSTLEQLPTPRRILAMTGDQVELLLKSSNWDGMIEAGKLPASFPSTANIMAAGGAAPDAAAKTLAALLRPEKLTEIVRTALRLVPGGNSHITSLERGITEAKAAVGAAVDKAVEATPALAFVKRTAESLIALKSTVEEATRDAKKGLEDAATAAKKASELQQEAMEAKLKSLAPALPFADQTAASAHVEELMRAAEEARRDAVEAVSRHAATFENISSSLVAQAEAIMGGGGPLEQAGEAIPEGLKTQAAALVAAAEGFRARAADASGRLAAVTADADAAKEAMRHVEAVAKRYAALADVSAILTKAFPADTAEIALAFAESPADPEAQKAALAKIGDALAKAAREANWEGLQGAASRVAAATASNGLVVQVPETVGELAADPARAIAVLRALAGDAPSVGETSAAAAAAFTAAGTVLGPYVEAATARAAAQMTELRGPTMEAMHAAAAAVDAQLTPIADAMLGEGKAAELAASITSAAAAAGEQVKTLAARAAEEAATRIEDARDAVNGRGGVGVLAGMELPAAMLEHPVVAAAKEALGPAGAQLARLVMDNPVLDAVQRMVDNTRGGAGGGGGGANGGLAQRVMDGAAAAGRMLMKKGEGIAPAAGVTAATAAAAGAVTAANTWDNMVNARAAVISESVMTADDRMELHAEKSSARLWESKAAASAKLNASIKKNLKGGMRSSSFTGSQSPGRKSPGGRQSPAGLGSQSPARWGSQSPARERPRKNQVAPGAV